MSYLFRRAFVFRAERREFTVGDVLVSNGRILAVTEGCALSDFDGSNLQIVDAEGLYLIPGLVDVHTHGRAGGDFSTADRETILRMSQSYLASGVTTLMPTLASAPLDELYAAADRLESVRIETKDCPEYATFAGMHLEGRYLNPGKRGAHAPHLLAPPDAEEATGLLARCGGAKHISAALEMADGQAFLDRMKREGATVGLGHTAATYSEAMAAIEGGVVSMTHLFNAMPPLHHRDGGAVCAGLLSPGVYCELICDGYHIAPEMVKLAFSMKKDHLTLITDSMEATDCADGEYAIAGMPVIVKDGKARTIDGAIAGSTLSLWEAVNHLRDFAGATLAEAVYAATAAPAQQVGLYNELGSLDAGKRADLLLVDGKEKILRVMHHGVFVS